jgi:hypothetical protein
MCQGGPHPGSTVIFQPIGQAFDPGTHLAGPLDRGFALVKDMLGNACRRGDLGFENVGLAGKQHALRTQIRSDLIGAGPRGRDKHRIIDAFRPGRIDRQADRGENVEIVSLTRVIGNAVQFDVRKLDTGSV